MDERTYLCPDCDGYGHTGGEQLDVDDFTDELTCNRCEESGVIRMDRSKADDLGLQPWTGEEGRNAVTVRTAHVDSLVRMGEWRERAASAMRQWGSDWRFTEYGWIRKTATNGYPIARLRMVEAAIGCDVAARVAVAAWRKSA